jgi:hypothetical protein
VGWELLIGKQLIMVNLPVKIVIPECENGYISGQTWNITFVDR